MTSRAQRFRIWNQQRKKARLAKAIAAATEILNNKIKHLEQHRSWLWQTTERYMNRYRAAEAKLKQKLSTDAGYALGEEAFLAGYEAAYNKTSGYDPSGAWADYEPSEEVKDLIG